MKNKLIYLLAAVSLLLVSLVFLWLGKGTQTFRYHQHLEQPSEADLGPCTLCDGNTVLCTHLPIIRIDTGGQKIPGGAILDETHNVTAYELGDNGEEMILAALSTVDTEGQWHHADDPSSQQASAMIRYRGNTSRAFSKHNFLIKLVDQKDPSRNENLPMLGMPADNEWALHGPFLDKTLLRNYMWMNISAEVMGYAPNVRFCELILDGEYQGVYVLMETITEGDARVNLTDYKSGDPICSYIVRIGSYLDPEKTIDTFYHDTYRLAQGKDVEVLYPTRLYQTQQVHDYINADLSEVEWLLSSSRMNSRSVGYRDHIDMNSFVNYYILQEFLAVNDAFMESTYFYRDVRGKLHIGPVWDYNNVLDNFIRPVGMDEFILAQTGWYGQLMRDEQFVQRVIRRYRELRKDILSEQRLNAYLDETIAWLGSAVERNYTVWGYSFDPELVSPVERRQPPLEIMKNLEEDLEKRHASDEEAYRRTLEAIRTYNPRNYQEAVDWMHTAMNERGRWLDRHIESLRQYCATSKNATLIDY